MSTLPVLVHHAGTRGRDTAGLGLVRSDVDDPHVPRGASEWELGTSRDPRAKAQSDIHDRNLDPQGVDPATTTFVAVTSRLWRDRDAWRTARRADSPWAERLCLRLFAVAGRLARGGRRLWLRLAERWPWANQITSAITRMQALPAG